MSASRARSTTALAAALTLAVACESPVNQRLLEVDANGSVLVFIYRDDNLNKAYNAGVDRPVANATYSLRMRGGTNVVKVTTDTAGLNLAGVPAGRYTLEVEATVLGDSLEVIAGTAEFTIAATDTVNRDVIVAYKTVSPTAARASTIGRRVWLNGVALNAPGTFGDSTVHVTDGLSSIRAFAVLPAPIVAGDSVLFLGRVATLDGQPAFEVASQLVRGARIVVLPDTVTTAEAAAARGGLADAALVRVLDAAIGDTATDPLGNRILTVDDGSGALVLILSRNQSWAPINQFTIGAKLHATGVLIPDPAKPSAWLLKPRTRSDVLVF